MNFFDAGILHFLNGFAHRSWTIDSWVMLLSDCDLLKGGVIVTLLWWAWFLPSKDIEKNRKIVLCTTVGSIFALALARGLALTLPFRKRPFQDPALHLHLAYGMDPNGFINWSSFPSDHAVLFFELATGLFLVSRRIGAIAFSWVFLVICLPRIYLGIHYPTDVIVGAAIGSGIACVARLPKLRSAIGRPAFRWMVVHPASFYASFFAATYQIAENFDPLRQIGNVAFQMALHIATRMHH